MMEVRIFKIQGQSKYRLIIDKVKITEGSYQYCKDELQKIKKHEKQTDGKAPNK
jgi:hypothetical protein